MLTFVPFQEETVAKLTFAGLPVDYHILSDALLPPQPPPSLPL
jgi:hypothetical protein